MSGESILVVDDNLDNLLLTEILLDTAGYEVRTAQDAGQAWEALRLSRPSLILMDIQLPGTDGLDLTRQLRQTTEFRDLPIVALTAYAMKGDEENARRAGCDGYITKPIDTRTFASTIGGFLREPQTASGARPPTSGPSGNNPAA